jgi:hypothetical protein
MLSPKRANPPRGLGVVCQRFAMRVHGAEPILRYLDVKLADPPPRRRHFLIS